MIVESAFRPAWWLRSPHAQTLWASLVRRVAVPGVRRERLELPDGDFLDLDWSRRGTGPVVLVLHGLEGSLESRYARGIFHALEANGWRPVLMHFRGCSGVPNRLPRSYHSGDTADLNFVARTLEARAPGTPVAAVGYSLGGNVLLKWLAECGAEAPVRAAAAVSVPMLLGECASRLERGFSRLYQWKLLRSLHRKTRAKLACMALPVEAGRLAGADTFRRFDDAVTAPLHGFRGVDDYYAKASSRQYLAGIRVPTLIVHARDDPFMSTAVIPVEAELSPSTTLELSRRGGHVGFVSGTVPGLGRYWLDRRIPEFLASHLER